MSAGLVSAKVDVQNPETNVTGARVSGRARSSVEIKDSCNCFKMCFPCWGNKEKETRIERVRQEVLPISPPQQPAPPELIVPTIKRSPSSDNLSHYNMQNITVHVHCDHSPTGTPAHSSPALVATNDDISSTNSLPVD